jgi:hypothetical protein
VLTRDDPSERPLPYSPLAGGSLARQAVVPEGNGLKGR